LAWDAGAIVSKLTLDRSKFSAAIKQVSGQVKGFGGLIKKNSAQIKKMGRTMTVAGAAIVGAVAGMVKAYASFDEAMTRSLAIMGDVSPAMRKEMAKTAKQLSTETTFAAKELAEAYYFLASAGMSAEASVSALEPVARFAQAGTFDLALATDLLTDAQTALGLSTKDVIQNEKNLIRVSDVLVGANTLANASVLQFSEALTNKAAAALVNLNKEVEEGVAVLAAYADKGVKGRLAGTRLTMMLNGLFAATRENKKAWDEAGISLWEADGSMRSIGDIIQDLEGYLGSMTVKQREAELAVLGFNIKTKDSILTLMGSSEKIKEWTGNLYEMRGITKEVADKQLKAFNAQLTLLKNVVMGAAISIGESLAPMLEDLIAKIKDVAARISEWIKEHPKLTALVFKLALGIGALMTVLGPLAMILPGLVTGFGLLKVAVIALAGPVGLATAAILAIAIGIKKMADNLTEARKAMSDFADEAAVLANAAENFQKLWIVVRKEGGETLEQFNELFKRFGGNWDSIMKTIIKDPKFAALKALLLDIASGVKTVDLEGKELSISLPKNIQKVNEAVKSSKNFWLEWARYIVGAERIVAEKLMKLKGMAEEPYDLGPAFTLPDFTLGERKFKTFAEYVKALFEEMAASTQTAWQAALAGSREIVGALDSLFGQFHENEAMRIDNQEKQQTDAIESWYERERTKIEATITNEEEKVAALEALDEEKARKENKLQHKMDKERRTLERSRAKAQKATALFAAGINVAEAITKAFTAGPIIGQILAGIVAALGAIQMVAIAAAPLPALQMGGRIEEAAIVGERGPELFVPGRPGMIIPLRREAEPVTTMRMRIIIQNKITVGEQTFYKESVKSINKAGEAGDLIVPNTVMV